MKKKTKEKDLTGEIFKLSELQIKFLGNISARRISGEQMQESGAALVIEAKKALWDTIFEFVPEAKDYHTIYNADTGELKIAGKKLERRKDEQL